MSTIGEVGRKNKRKESLGVGTYKKQMKSPDGKLTVEFDEETRIVVGIYCDMYNNALHAAITKNIDLNIFVGLMFHD